MRPSKRLPISLAALLLTSSLLISQVTAQANLPKLPDVTTDGTTAAAATTAAKTTADGKNTNTAAATTEPSLTELPKLTSTTAYDGITGAPKIGIQPVTPMVPPTADAPFMQKSSLPEGTVFICVGAALGFLGMTVLAWRGLVAWSLHRSVRRSALAQTVTYGHDRDTKRKRRRRSRRGSAAPFYSHRPGSSLSLDQLGTSGKPRTKGHTPTGSLFFSPTAGTGMHTPANRGSGYLPAGYYAAGNSAPGGGTGTAHIGGASPKGLANLGPQGKGYNRASSMGPSPPDSPNLPPSRGSAMPLHRLSNAGLSTQASNSTLNLTNPPQGRAPSVYLEDLFENHPPSDLSGGPHGSGRRNSGY